MILKIVKEVFIPQKDYAGRSIDEVIQRLAAQTGTKIDAWSYIAENSVYENTLTGMKIYPHEISRT